MVKKDYLKCLYVIPYILLYNFVDIISNYKSMFPVYQRFLQELFQGSYNLEKVDIFVSIVGIGYIVIYNILFGTVIYKDTAVASEYLFTRFSGRLKWYTLRLLRIIGTSIFCNFLYVGLKFLIVVKSTSPSITSIDITVLASVFIIMTLFTVFSTLLANVAAFFVGSNAALIVLYLLEGISTSIAFIQSASKMPAIFVCLNPMSNVLISWNYNSIKAFWPAFYFVMLILAVAAVGYWKIMHIDILPKKNDD